MFDKSDEEHWYALKVFYNRVFDVERLLAQDGVKTYIPLRSTETTVGGRTIRRREPAVSSLMFVRQAERAVLELMQRAKATSPLMVYFDRETKKPAVIPDPEMYKGENETYIEASAENGGSVLYDKEIRDKPRTRRTKRNV